MSRLPSLGPRGEGWVLGQFALLWAIIVAAWVGGTELSGPMLAAVRVLGAATIFLGLAFAGLGISQLDRSLSVLPKPVEGGVLIERGLYGRVRHPIYAGVILMGAGASIYTASWIAAVITLALATWLDLKARREEVWLRQRYPGYAEYASRTKRFVPRLY